MSNTKTVMSQAANTLTAPIEVEDVFSTYLYEGNSSTQTITNGIDLDGEGGLVWIKERNNVSDHGLFDTERGKDYRLRSNTTNSQTLNSGWVTSFNSNGFGVGSSNSSTGSDYASWTFRKAPKFFTCLTYTGTGSAQNISHDLGSDVGTLIVKRTDAADSWRVYHREMDATSPQNYYMNLDETAAASAASTVWNNTAPTSTEFTVGTSPSVNGSGSTYVAYLFAHNDGDGGFNGGDIIKCGSFDGASNTEVDLGFEPQWILWKSSNGAFNWGMVDNMRGIPSGGNDSQLLPNGSEAETANENVFDLNPTGFTWKPNASGNTYIYIAIRRGTKVPESGTEVFAMARGSSSVPPFDAGFPIDFGLVKRPSDTDVNRAVARLTGNQLLKTESNDAQSTSSVIAWDYQEGFYNFAAGSEYQAWMWKRAPKFFDAVAYTGDGVAGRTVSHNLGVAPEMMWVKNRDSSAASWTVYVSSLGATQHMVLNEPNASSDAGGVLWNYTEPTDTVFTVGNNSGVNGSGSNIIAYLFASLDGISKVGSYTGNGTSQTIDCGFTSGARFILVKRTDNTGDWYVWDTERGIVAGNDPYLELNTTDAEVTSTDWVDPDNSGFIVNGTTINASSASYIFYAIA